MGFVTGTERRSGPMRCVMVLLGTAIVVTDGRYVTVCRFRPMKMRSLLDDKCCLVMVKQSNNYPIKQAALRSISQTNNVKSIFQTVNTNRSRYLDCLTVDRPGIHKHGTPRMRQPSYPAANSRVGCCPATCPSLRPYDRFILLVSTKRHPIYHLLLPETPRGLQPAYRS